jgi:hypothetical protein
MNARKLRPITAGSVVFTVPIEFVRELGIPEWVERTGSTDYTVWLTWLPEREAVSYFFPDPDTPQQPDAAISRQLQIKPLQDGNRVYLVTIPAKILTSRGITDEVLDDGYTVFPDTSIEDRLLTIELERPDERANPWSGLENETPESPTADWLLEGTKPDGTEPEPTSPLQRGD